MLRDRFRMHLACALLLAPGVWAQTLKVVTADGNSITITTEQLAALPHVTLDVRDHDTPAKFTGVPVAKILEKAGVKFDAKLHVPAVSDVVVVEGADGYKAAYGMGEIDPSIAPSQVIVAVKRDGKAMDEKEGPLQVISSGDKRATRWVRQTTALRVVSTK